LAQSQAAETLIASLAFLPRPLQLLTLLAAVACLLVPPHGTARLLHAADAGGPR
jgi:hypothetical protein